MERLGGEDGVDRGIRQRDLLGASGQQAGLGTHRHEQAAHPFVGLDGNDIFESGHEQARELPRPTVARD
jgi:hypothetical protein